MKNFQVNMVNKTASYYHQTFAFQGSKLLLGTCFVESRILYFWYVLKSIHKFIIEFHALQCLFVRWSNKKQRRDRIISNFTKGETFSSSPQFGQEENIPGHSIERRAYWFILKIAMMFPIPLSKNRMMSTFIIIILIANITPYPKR